MLTRHRVPFYSWIRLFFFSYLVLPQTQGARLLYQTYVDPFLEHHEREIEEFIGRSHERAKALGLQYFYQAVDWVREKVLHLPAQRATTAPPAGPSGPASYAQSLLSRFNLPSATGAVPTPTTDWFSAISSAVTAVTSTGKSPEARAEELSASGTLLPREMASMSREEKARFLSNQRDLLDVVRNALAREERNLDESPEEDLAYGSASASSLRKNRSDNSFDHIQPEDVRDRSPSRGTWTSGWFGERGDAVASGAEFAARTVEEITRSRSTRS
ncbi:hypothetical protein BDV59DRAFT_186673 [Aspergillus ambiguus]|uniref:HVA22/TB2/DP1 family protein n=1 Tax=Aspergillus ambiguus TaxID=176160 RepID=UPI003CCE1A02